MLPPLSFSPAKSPQSPSRPDHKRPFSHPPPTLMRQGSHIIAWFFWLRAGKDRQTLRWADGCFFSFIVFFFPLPEISQSCCLKKLILFHSPLIKSQRIPRVHCLLQQHPALDLAFSSCEGSDDVLSHVWCLAFTIKCSFENSVDVNSSPEHVVFEVGKN